MGNAEKYKNPYEIIEQKLKENHNNKKKIVLLTTGSYNPIHRMHLTMLKIAKDHLEEVMPDIEVLCGFISPSNDDYVKSKRVDAIPIAERVKMIESAIEEYNCDLDIKLHLWEASAPHFVDFPYVQDYIQKEIYKKFPNENIIVVYVCGLDLVLTCGGVRGFVLKRNFVAIDRKPYSSKSGNFINDIKKITFLFKDDRLEPLSSTDIRNLALAHDQNSINTIKSITFNSVADMYIQWFNQYHSKKGDI